MPLRLYNRASTGRTIDEAVDPEHDEAGHQHRALKDTALAKVHFWMSTVGVLGQVIGAYQFATSGGTEIAIIAASSVVALLAGVLMAWLFLAKSAVPERRPEARIA